MPPGSPLQLAQLHRTNGLSGTQLHPRALNVAAVLKRQYAINMSALEKHAPGNNPAPTKDGVDKLSGLF